MTVTSCNKLGNWSAFGSACVFFSPTFSGKLQAKKRFNPRRQRQQWETCFRRHFYWKVEFLTKIVFPSKRNGQAVLPEQFRGRGCKGKRGVGYIPARGHVKPLKLESLVHQSAGTAGGKRRYTGQTPNIMFMGKWFVLWSCDSAVGMATG